MATFHIPEAEAANHLSALLKRVYAGDEVMIDGGERSVRLTMVPAGSEPDPSPRLLSEAIAMLRARNSQATLDPGFATDVQAGIKSHQHESLGDRWD